MTDAPLSSHDPDEDATTVTIFEVMSVVIRRWRAVVGIPVGVAVLAAIVSLILPSVYTARASFTPEAGSDGSSSSLGGLAAQFLGTAAASGGSTGFYADLVTSNVIENAVLLTPMHDPRATHPDSTATLLDILDIDPGDTAVRLAAGRKKLADMVSVTVSPESQILTVAAEARYPALAAAIANRILGLVDQFNREQRQTQGAQRRRFAEDRLADADAELLHAEEALRNWLEQNRAYASSPNLNFQYDRLERQVHLKEAVATTLRQEYEQARIQEVNDTPLITVVDSAVAPTERSRPNRRVIVMLAFLLAGVFTLVGLFASEIVTRARERYPADYERLVQAWDRFRTQVRALWRRKREA